MKGYDSDLFEALWGAEPHSFWFRARNALLLQTIEREFAGARDMLEIGCGTGYVLQALREHAGLEVTGSELFEEGLEYARRRVPEATLVQLDASDMRYAEAFDVVGAFDVLEHVEDDRAVLAGCRRALRPGGGLLLTVPQHPWLWSYADDLAHHVRRYTRRELVAKVRDAGLEVRRVSSFISVLLPAMALARLRSPAVASEAALVRELVPPAPINRLFEALLALERRVIAAGVSLPAGGSLLLAAVRPASASSPLEGGADLLDHEA